jgi:hypothetical protein
MIKRVKITTGDQEFRAYITENTGFSYCAEAGDTAAFWTLYPDGRVTEHVQTGEGLKNSDLDNATWEWEF